MATKHQTHGTESEQAERCKKRKTLTFLTWK